MACFPASPLEKKSETLRAINFIAKSLLGEDNLKIYQLKNISGTEICFNLIITKVFQLVSGS